MESRDEFYEHVESTIQNCSRNYISLLVTGDVNGVRAN